MRKATSCHPFRNTYSRRNTGSSLGCAPVTGSIPWNMHEPRKGVFCFDGMLDIGWFVGLAQELGLYVILRPSPYICSEWELGDTFLDFAGWGKGCVFVNGFNIGRFWEISPQKRLYIPAPLLKRGTNDIIIFETEGKVRNTIFLRDEPDIGGSRFHPG